MGSCFAEIGVFGQQFVVQGGGVLRNSKSRAHVLSMPGPENPCVSAMKRIQSCACPYYEEASQELCQPA